MRARERVMQRVVVDEAGCWVWQGGVNSAGYGQIRVDGQHRYVHRLMFELDCESIPRGMVIDHLCRVTRCCNPAHLELVTHAENIRRGYEAKGQTHCKRGHDLAVHARITKDGRRDCRLCDVARRAERKAALS